MFQVVKAFGVPLAHWGQDEGPEERQPDLPAMGVAGEHEVDEGTARVVENVVCEVGLVRHEDDGAIGFGGNGEIEVGMAGAGVVDATEPEAVASSFDGEILIDQYGSAVGDEGLGHQWAVEGDVMVAEDGVAEGRGEGGDDLGATMESVAAGDEGKRAVGDEVAGEKDEVGRESVDLLDDAFKEKGLGVLVQVNVAELGDAIAVKGSRQIVDGDGALDDVDFMPGELAGVESKSSGGDAGAYEKASAAET